jgi:hypothetical protein
MVSAMTAAFGRRKSVASPPVPPAPGPELVLTPQQRAYLFADQKAAEIDPARSLSREKPVRRAGLIACAAMTAAAVALSSIGKHESALAGLPTALAPMGQEFLAQIGSVAGPFALAWSILIDFFNFCANLWLTRKLGGALGAGTPAFVGLGALTGVAMASLSAVFGLGASDIGLPLEALAGAGVAWLYRLLSGAARL